MRRLRGAPQAQEVCGAGLGAVRIGRSPDGVRAGGILDSQAVEELIKDGETGLVVPIEDVAAVSTAVLRLLGAPALAARLGAAARRAIEQRHRAEGTVAQLSALYATMIDSPEGVL